MTNNNRSVAYTVPMGQEYHFIRNTVKFIGITLVVYLFLDKLLPMVFPFLVAIFLAGVLHPLQLKILKRRTGSSKKKESLKSIVSIILLLLIAAMILLVIIGVGYLAISQFRKMWDNRQDFIDGINEMIRQIELGIAPNLLEKLQENGILDKLSNRVTDFVMDNTKSAGTILGGAFGGFVSIVVVMVGAYILLKDYEEYHNAIIKSPLGEVVLALGKDLKKVGGSYLKAQGIIMSIVMGICVGGLFIIGNSYALLLGILIGFFDALPFLGTAVIFVPWACVEFLQQEIGLGIYFLGLTMITTVTRQFLEPKLIGDQVGANPFLVLLSIYVGLQIFGVWGFILGPVAAFLIWEIYRFT